MEEQYEKAYHRLERDHFWFKARRNYILQELRRADRNSKILDIGCSSGVLLSALAEMGFNRDNLYGVDISDNAIDNAKQAGLKHVFVMDAQSIELDENFDFIIASDCLEHLEDDHRALRNWHGLLKPGGTALIFVPAFMSLWSEHDEVNMHFRRYTRRELKQKLTGNGFNLVKSSYWNFFLFPPIFLVRKLENVFATKKHDAGDLDKIPAFNGLLAALLNFENKLLKAIDFPVGVSTFCIAKKPLNQQ